MLAGPNAYSLIKFFEGLRLRSYMDAKGTWTIGWGHTGEDVHPDQIIGMEDALRFLSDDVHWAETQLMKLLIRHPIPQHHFDAMVSWIFNVGVERARKSTLIKFYNFGQDVQASTEFLKWSKVRIQGRPTVFKGLTNRRNAERELFLTGVLTL